MANAALRFLKVKLLRHPIYTVHRVHEDTVARLKALEPSGSNGVRRRMRPSLYNVASRECRIAVGIEANVGSIGISRPAGLGSDPYRQALQMERLTMAGSGLGSGGSGWGGASGLCGASLPRLPPQASLNRRCSCEDRHCSLV